MASPINEIRAEENVITKFSEKKSTMREIGTRKQCAGTQIDKPLGEKTRAKNSLDQNRLNQRNQVKEEGNQRLGVWRRRIGESARVC